MTTSVTTTENSRSCRRRSASVPEAAATTSTVPVSRAWTSVSRSASSSSTTRIACSAIAGISLAGVRRKDEGELRALARLGTHFDSPGMRLDDAPHHREPEAGARLLRAEVRLEDLRAHFLRHPCAGVDHL